MGDGDIEIKFAGERLGLTPERAAVWDGALMLADTHWGKIETHRASGVPLPSGDVDEQLGRLDSLVARLEVERIIVVGDLLHAGRGITDELIASVGSWRERMPLNLTLVAGNHDMAIDRVAGAWGIEVIDDELDLGPFTLRHVPGHDRPTIAGHIHPVVGVRGDGDRVRLPCYWVHSETLILPAFSTFTGGARVRPEPGDSIYAVAGDLVVPVESTMLSR